VSNNAASPVPEPTVIPPARAKWLAVILLLEGILMGIAARLLFHLSWTICFLPLVPIAPFAALLAFWPKRFMALSERCKEFTERDSGIWRNWFP
jgi:hypothetical protein